MNKLPNSLSSLPWRAIAPVAALAATVLVALAPNVAYPQSATYTATFDGTPSAPSFPYRPTGFDVTTIAHEDGSIDGMYAGHGPNCEAPDNLWTPGTAPNTTHNHFIHTAPETTYQCNGHLMTAINAGYGAIYLTPPALLDFSSGAATLTWDMSTERTASRDWVDFVFMPYQTGFPGPMALNMQDFHTPEYGLQFDLVGGGNVLSGHVFLHDYDSSCASGSYWRGDVYYCRINSDGYHTWDMKLAEHGLTTSASRRDHFRIEITRTHVKVGFKPAGFESEPYFDWIDEDIPGGQLPYTQVVAQLNQRAYNPLKPCADGLGTNAHAGEPGAQDGWEGDCRAGTWHWDNFSVSPAIPFSIIPSTRSGDTFTFATAAPAGSYIKAAGGPNPMEYSLDGGTTWNYISVVGPVAPPEIGDSYWQAVPEGTTSVTFRGPNGWAVQDVYLYSLTNVETGGTPTPTPTPGEPTPTPTVTPTPAPTSTPTPTPTPPASGTVDFNSESNPNRTLNGVVGPIDFGTNEWYLSAPWHQFSTNSIGFNGAGPTSGTFTFSSPRTLISIDALSGAGDSTVTISCDGNPMVTATAPLNTPTTITTGWSTPCSEVTVTSSNGWDTNFDNIVYGG